MIASWMTERKWQVVAVLFFAGGLNYVDRTSIAAVFPLLRAELHATDVQLGAIGSAFLWSYAAAVPFAGMLADRLSRSALIVFSLAAWSAITMLCGMVTDIGQLLFLRGLLGVAESVYVPAAVTLIADHHEPGTRATAMGLHLAGLNLAVVVGGTMCGYLGENFGWRVGLIVLGVSGLALSVVARKTLHDGPRAAQELAEKRDLRGDLLAIARVKTYWIIVSEQVLTSIGVWMFFNWMPLYFRETFGMGLTAAAFSGTVLFQAAAVIGISAGGYISDRVTKNQPVRRMYLLGGFYCAAAPFLLMFIGTPSLVPLSICVFLSSLLRTLGQTNEGPILCEVLSPRRRALALGIMSCCTMTSGGIGVLAAGYLKEDYGLGGVFAGVSAAVLLSGLLALLGAVRYYPRDIKRAAATVEFQTANSMRTSSSTT
jgi:predicted MFS family arabinose efflux permease